MVVDGGCMGVRGSDGVAKSKEVKLLDRMFSSSLDALIGINRCI